MNTRQKSANNFELKLILASLLLVLLVMMTTHGKAATNTMLSNGAWETPANWSRGSVPSNSDDVVIPGDIVVSINSAAVCGSLTIGDAGAASTISITGSNSLTITTAGGGNGNLYFNPNNNSELYQINVNAGSLTVEGQVVSGGYNGGTISVSSGSVLFSSTATMTWGEAVNVTISAAGNVTFNGDLSLSAVTSGFTSFSNTGGGTLTFNGSVTQSDPNSTITNSGVAGDIYFNDGYIRSAGTFTSMSGEDIYVTTEFTNSGTSLTLDPGSNFYVYDDAAINPSASVALGNITINTGKVFSMGGDFSVAGAWTNNGTTLPGSSTVTFNATTSKTIAGTAATQDFYNIIVALTAGQTLSVAGSTTTLNTNNLTMTTGNFSAGTASTMNVGGDLTISSGTYTAGTTTNLTGSLSNAGTWASAAGRSLNFVGSTSATVSGAGTFTIYNIALNKSTKTTPVEITSSSFITGINTGAVYNFTLTRGTLKYNNSATLTDCHNLGVTTALTIPFDVVIESNAGTMNLCRAGTMATATRSNVILSGKLWVNGGTVNVLRATTLVDFQYKVNGGTPQLYVTLGTLNLGAGFNYDPGTGTDYVDFQMVGGAINTGTTSNYLSTFALNDVSGGSTLMSAGTITIEDATTGSYPDLDFGGDNLSSYSVTGGTITFGTATTSAASIFTFQAYPNKNYPHIAISTSVAKTLKPYNNADFKMLSLTIPTGMTFDMRDDVSSSDTKKMTLTGASGGIAFTRNGSYQQRTGTIELAGTTSQSINSTSGSVTLYNLIINSSSTVTFGGSTTTLAVQDFTMTQGTMTAGTVTSFTVNGNVVLTAGTMNGPSNLYARGNWTNNGGTFAYGSNTVNFTGTGTQTIDGTASAESFYNLTINKTSGTLLTTGGSIATLNCLNNLTMSQGNFTPPATLSITGNYTLTLGTLTAGATINVGGNWSHANSASAIFTPGTGTVNFNGSGTQSITGAKSSETFYNVTVNKTAGSLLRASASIATLNFQSYTQTTGDFTANTANTITTAGAFTINSGTFTAGTTVTNNGAFTLNNGTYAAGSTTTFNSTMVVNNGTYTAGTTTNLYGNTTFNGGTYTAGATTNVRGDWTFNTGSTYTTGTGTTNFTGTTNQTINGTASSVTFNHVVINKTAGTLFSTGGSIATLTTNNLTQTLGDITAPATLNINGNFTLTAGTFTAGALVDLKGNISKAVAHIFTPGTGIFRFTGTGTQNINGAATSITFYNMEVNKTAASVLQRAGNIVTITAQDVTQNQGDFTAPPTFNINGNFVLNDGTFGASTTINLYGNWTHASTVTAVFSPNTGTVNFLGGSAQTIGGTVTSETFNRLTVNKTAGTGLTTSGSINSLTLNSNFTQTQGNFTSPATMTVGGSLTITDGTFTAGTDLTLGGSWSRTSTVTAIFNHNNGTITFNGTGTQNIQGTTTTETFNNVIINKSAGTLTTAGSVATLNVNDLTLSAGTFNSPATFNINGDYTLDAGTWVPSTNTYLYGDLINNGSTITVGSSTVRLSSTSATQTIGGAATTTLYNLVLNNTSGTTPQIEVTNTLQVNNTLTFTSGVVDLNGTTLTIGSSAASRGSIGGTPSTTSYLGNGSVRRWFTNLTIPNNNSSGLFPVGDIDFNGYSPIYLSMPATAPTGGGSVTASYTGSATNTNVSFLDGATPIQVRTDAGWTLSTAAGLTGGTYNLNAGRAFCAICVGSVNDLRLVLTSGVVGTAGTNSGTTTFPYAQRTGLSLANLSNTFFIGSTSSSNSPLPVELGDFKGAVNKGKVELTFTTYSETNNDYFTIDRSTDGIIWEHIATVDGSGNSNNLRQYATEDAHPVPGNALYRLSQTDFNGDNEILKSIVVRLDKQAPTKPVVYPNPANGTEINIEYTSAGSGQIVIELININGQKLFQQEVTVEEGIMTSLQLHPKTKMNPGKYLIRVIDGDSIFSEQLIVR